LHGLVTLRRLLTLVAVILAAPSALAGPLDDAHVADTGFSGPTSGDLTAIYWNPAGLGMLQGPQLMIGGSLQATSVRVDRTSIDPTTGTSPGSTNFSTASGSGTLQPLRWPLGPASFIGIGAGFGHRFAIALALYSPFSFNLSMPADAPTRYQLVSMDLNHLAPTIGLAIHATDSIQIGVAPSFIFPTAHLVFKETPVGGSSEDPTTAATYDLATQGILVPAYILSFGAQYRRGRFSLGISYTSAPLGTGGMLNLPLGNVHIYQDSAAGKEADLCDSTNPHNPNCLAGQLSYRLPSIYNLGATWQATKNWSVTGIVRWLRYGGHDKVSILLSGPPDKTALGTSLPDHVVLYRGFQDSFDLRGRVVWENKQMRVGGTLRLETSAVPAANVNAAAIDGTKLEPSVAVEMRIWRQIRMSAGYAFLWMFPVDTGTSVFDPTAASTCASASGDLSTPACQARMNGQARPSAAGNYRQWRQTLSVMTTFAF
jgi:long-subunit fatty acid transport protein